MVERDRAPRHAPGEPTGTPPERRGRDGDAGPGDMRGGLGAGAGDRRGPARAGDEPESPPRTTQQSCAGEGFATDAARNDHHVGGRV